MTMVSTPPELITRLNEAARVELTSLYASGARLSEMICQKLELPPAYWDDWGDMVTYPYACTAYGASFVMLSEKDCIAVTSPRVFKLLYGRPLSKLRLDQVDASRYNSNIS